MPPRAARGQHEHDRGEHGPIIGHRRPAAWAGPPESAAARSPTTHPALAAGTANRPCRRQCPTSITSHTRRADDPLPPRETRSKCSFIELDRRARSAGNLTPSLPESIRLAQWGVVNSSDLFVTCPEPIGRILPHPHVL